MNRTKHFFMTLAALFFLGIIVAKPGSSFAPKENEEDCFRKDNKVCELKEYEINQQIIEYHY